MSQKLLKSTSVVSFMTLISRISGLVRDVIMANILGADSQADAFFVAFRIPNFLRRIFGEGAFSQAFVPVFSELRTNNMPQARQFINATSGLLGLIVLLLSVLGVLAAPWVVKLFAPGFISQPEKFNATVDALRIMFPYLFCISLVAMSAGVLNTINRFAIPAATPVLLNICLIMALLYLVPTLDNAAQALAIGVLIAGFAQLLFQVPSLIKSGYFPKPVIDMQNEPSRRVFKLMLPAIFSVSVAQVNMLVNTFLASFLVTGSVSWLYYSDRLMEFPVGVFGIALATVVLPSLSRQYVSGSAQGFSDMLDWALRWVMLIALPASVALIILATPLLSTIFQYNAFTIRDVEMSSSALMAFSVGVLGFILVKVLAPGFFARQDTKTPMRIAVISVLANILMSIVLVRFMAHTGLALAISLAAWINAGLLYLTLRRQHIFQPKAGWLMFLFKVLIAVLVMAGLLCWFKGSAETWHARDLVARLWNLVFLVLIGGSSYFAMLLILGLRPKQFLFQSKEPPLSK